jgi:hypothetical protein
MSGWDTASAVSQLSPEIPVTDGAYSERRAPAGWTAKRPSSRWEAQHQPEVYELQHQEGASNRVEAHPQEEGSTQEEGQPRQTTSVAISSHIILVPVPPDPRRRG